MREVKEADRKRKEKEDAEKKKQQQDQAAKTGKKENELKKKAHTYDYNGNILFIKPAKIDKLPPSSYNVK